MSDTTPTAPTTTPAAGSTPLSPLTMKELEELGFLKPEDRPNPFNLPKKSLLTGLTLYGQRVPDHTHFTKCSPLEHIKRVRNMAIRDDDVLLAAYPKSGTHWLWEVVHMLVHRTTEYEERKKEFNMLEFIDPESLVNDESPRVLNSHFWFCHLPQEILAKKNKIIHVVRNPKDVLVSHFFHYKPMAEEGFTMENFMQGTMDNNQFHTQNQLEYLRQMSQFQKSNPDHPFKVVYYEEMKKDPVATIKELAEFLQVPHTEEFCRDVAVACSFDNLKKADENKRDPGFKKGGKKINMYRKGTIGDWKNHLTVAQNEVYDSFIAKEIEKGGLDYTFIYSY